MKDSTSTSSSAISLNAMPPDAKVLAEISAFACELADAARQAILPYWRCPERSIMEIEHKIDHDRSLVQAESPVTIADRAAERDMRRLIERRYPEHGIIGEEFGNVRVDDDDDGTAAADWIWVLDPIDGTKAFITGRPQFGTLIACLYKGVPVVGVIDQCVLDERWVGVAGSSSGQAATTTLNGVPIQTESQVTSLSDAALMASSPGMFAPGLEANRFAQVSRACKFTTFGSDCYAYALVASGFGAHVVVEADLGLYDYCALVPVLEGAGGVMTDWTGARLTLQNHAVSRGRVVACANRALHAAAVEILNSRTITMPGITRALPFISSLRMDTAAALAVGVMIGMVLSRR
jgi:inositol-phosphate phosphatase / L-galactose 1-phosphate phosphatase / histidinol-phosphatase